MIESIRGTDKLRTKEGGFFVKIDRRSFLKALLILSAVPLIEKFDLDTKEGVDDAWSALNENPFVFQVSEDGCLSDPGYEALIKRSQVYDIPTTIKDISDFEYCIEDWQPFRWRVMRLYDDFRENISDAGTRDIFPEVYYGGEIVEDEDTLQQWLAYVGEDKFIKYMNAQLLVWLNEDFSSDEQAYADIPLNSEAYVFIFFRNEVELCEMLDIELVDGSYPGDDSQTAILNGSVEKANTVCREQSIPLRFESA